MLSCQYPKSKIVRKIFPSTRIDFFMKERSYPINPRRKNCIKREPLSGGLSFLCIQRRAENSKELEHKKDRF
jgi:hypothetical protein